MQPSAFSLAGTLALAASLAALSPAQAHDPRSAPLPRHLAAERVLQLSPAAGVAVEYVTNPTVYTHPQGQVVFQGNLPVGVVAPNGAVVPLGGARIGTPVVVAPAPVVVAPVRAAPQVAVAPLRTHAPQPEARGLDPMFLPQTVAYHGPHGPGTVVIDTRQRFLFLVEGGGQARRYGVGVGKEGFSWRGTETVSRKAEWPGWTPPRQMIAREKAKGRILPAHMPGGVDNPLGARALYLGSTLYRIHGTNQPWTIGQAVSSGCIRMRNEDVIELYGRVPVGAKVVVL